LNTKGTSAANGLPFVVGDGATPATLHLDGGLHSFADGLIISSNATLSGCGTVIGNIINHGIIATNCGGTVTQFSINFQGRICNTNRVSLSSRRGSSYTLKFKNPPSAPNWTPTPPSTPGNGGTIILEDTDATGPTRFYRVRMQ